MNIFSGFKRFEKPCFVLSTAEIAEATTDALLTIGSIQDEYNECMQNLSLISRRIIVADYQEHKPAMKLLRQKSLEIFCFLFLFLIFILCFYSSLALYFIIYPNMIQILLTS